MEDPVKIPDTRVHLRRKVGDDSVNASVRANGEGRPRINGESGGVPLCTRNIRGDIHRAFVIHVVALEILSAESRSSASA